jgi:hypothetical protein
MIGFARFRRRYAHTRPPPVEQRGDGDAERGVVYLALGDDHAALAAGSVARLRRVGYAGPIRVVTDTTVWPGRDDVELIAAAAAGTNCPARAYKTQIDRFGFPITLFLDADMLPIGPIDGVWAELRHADICASLDAPRVQHFINHYLEQDEEPPLWPELDVMREAGLVDRPFHNSGLLLFRRTPETARVFAAWHEEWRRFGGRDQCALVRAVARTGARVHTLPACWNAAPTPFASIAEARALGVRVLHFFSGSQRDRMAALVAADA